MVKYDCDCDCQVSPNPHHTRLTKLEAIESFASCGVPQGSVLGHKYTSALPHIVEGHVAGFDKAVFMYTKPQKHQLPEAYTVRGVQSTHPPLTTSHSHTTTTPLSSTLSVISTLYLPKHSY